MNTRPQDDMSFQNGYGRQLAYTAAEFANGDTFGNHKINTNEIADGFSWNSLQEMGISGSTCLRYAVVDAVRNDPELAGLALSRIQGAEVSDRTGDHEKDIAMAEAEEEERQLEEERQQEEFEQNKRETDERVLAEKQALQDQIDHEKWEEKQFAQQRAEERAAADANNNKLLGMAFIGLPLALLGHSLLTGTADKMAEHADKLGGATMSRSNSGGELLADARNELGLQTQPGQDTIVTGPNQANTFDPGQQPQIAAGMNQMGGPGQTMNQNMAQIPGMSPGMTPGSSTS